MTNAYPIITATGKGCVPYKIRCKNSANNHDLLHVKHRKKQIRQEKDIILNKNTEKLHKLRKSFNFARLFQHKKETAG